MFGKAVIDTSTNKFAKSDKINREIRRVFWLVLGFCWSSRGTCAQMTTAFSYKSQPTQIWMPWVLGGKALPKNGRTTGSMGLYFLAREQSKGTGLELRVWSVGAVVVFVGEHTTRVWTTCTPECLSLFWVVNHFS